MNRIVSGFFDTTHRVLEDVISERMKAHGAGYGVAHDDRYRSNGQLIAFAIFGLMSCFDKYPSDRLVVKLPAELVDGAVTIFHGHPAKRDRLIKCIQLLVAEVERLDREMSMDLGTIPTQAGTIHTWEDLIK